MNDSDFSRIRIAEYTRGSRQIAVDGIQSVQDSPVWQVLEITPEHPDGDVVDTLYAEPTEDEAWAAADAAEHPKYGSSEWLEAYKSMGGA